jgi:hypothetical protein
LLQQRFSKYSPADDRMQKLSVTLVVLAGGPEQSPFGQSLSLKIRIEALEHRSAIVCTAACASSAHVVGHDPAMKFDAR